MTTTRIFTAISLILLLTALGTQHKAERVVVVPELQGILK